MQNHCLCLALKDQGIEEEREKEISDLFFVHSPSQAFEFGEPQANLTGTAWYITEGYLKYCIELYGEKQC